jgi:fibronectin-binding autotransporter adhesin
VSTFSGGITNSGGITSGAVSVLIDGVSVFSSGISNSGTISSSHHAISLRNIGSFAGIANSNLIRGDLGISIGGGVTFVAGAGIVNSGTIQGTSGTAIDLSTATAPVTIAQNGGTLLGKILFSPNGDTLSGNGSIVGNISTGNATIAPSLTGTGALAITGNFTQGPSGTTVIEVNPTTASKLTVSGTASLGGALRIVYDPGTYSARSYDIVHAGTIAGTYATPSGTAPSGFNQSVSYTSTDVDLVLTSPDNTGPPGSPIVVSTNTAVLGDFSSIALGNLVGAQGAVFDHLDSGDSGSAGTSSARGATTPVKIAMGGALGQVAQLGASMPDMLAHYGGWVRGIGHFQSADRQGAVAGYSASGGGFLAGIDHAFGPLTAGIAAGFSGVDFKQQDGSSGDVQTPRVMAYARYRAGPQVVVDGLAGFAYDSIHTVRPVAALGANAVENHSATEENFALQAGYVATWNGVTLIPRLGAQYVHLSQHGFSESGASGFDLAARSSRLDSFQPIASISASKAFVLDNGVRVTPGLKLAYSHELLDTSETLALTTPAGSLVPGTALTPARDTVTVGPEVTAAMTQQLSLYADYQAVIGIGKSLDNIVYAGARWRF